MAQPKPLSEIVKIDLDALVAKLKSSDDRESTAAGLKLAKDASSFGLSVRLS